MPYVKINTNVEITSEKTLQLMTELSRLLAEETGKPERYVMVEMMGSKTMLFAGSPEPLVYVECKSIGLTPLMAKSLSSLMPKLFNAELSVKFERIYIEFSHCPPEFWGWNGGTFA